MAVTLELERIIRPAAVLPEQAAAHIVAQLSRNDVAKGGVWNGTPTLWQRYDQPWDGFAGGRGNAQLIGSIAVVYDSPRRHQITIYKVTLGEVAVRLGWSVERLCDDALAWAGLTLRNCPRASLSAPPTRDPFHLRRPKTLTLG
jgi:hypothetical protein